MNKLILENRTDMSWAKALPYIQAIVDRGRISNHGKQHCYHTVFNDGVAVSSFLNKKSERLVVSRESREFMDSMDGML